MLIVYIFKMEKRANLIWALVIDKNILAFYTQQFPISAVLSVWIIINEMEMRESITVKHEYYEHA